MKLHVGSDITLRAANDCPIVAMLRPASGLAQWLSSETYTFDPWVPSTEYVDGFGNRPNKTSKYHEFTRRRSGRHHGFKLFYEEDTNLMQPRDVLRLRPPPELVVYE